MSFDPAESPLRHILQAIEHIREFTANLTFEQYEQSLIVRSAVERMFQILTEAAFRLGRDAPIICPGVDWRGVRGMGNFLRHDYELVTDALIWDAIHNDLPPLEIAVRAALSSQGPTAP